MIVQESDKCAKLMSNIWYQQYEDDDHDDSLKVISQDDSESILAYMFQGKIAKCEIIIMKINLII